MRTSDKGLVLWLHTFMSGPEQMLIEVNDVGFYFGCSSAFRPLELLPVSKHSADPVFRRPTIAPMLVAWRSAL
jgi:hypothetical protein